MTDTYRALCAELVTAVDEASDAVDRTSDCVNAANHPELWAQCVDLIRRQDDLIARARATLAKPVPPDDGEVADPVIPGEYRGFNTIAYRNGFHAGYKHALTRVALAPQPVPEGPSDEELDELAWNWFSKTGSTWWQIEGFRAFARAVLARWGQP
jgi:hypothetical protein